MTEQKSPPELAADTSSEDTSSFVRRVKRATRRKYTPEEKGRILPEGFRGEIDISALCRREGICRGPGGPGGIRSHGSRIVKPGHVPSTAQSPGRRRGS